MAGVLRTITGPFRQFGSWYLETAQKHPFATAFWTSGIKTSAADLIAQKVVEKREELDWPRHLGFVAFGFLYLGSVQYYLYNVKFVQWCGGITAQVGHAGVAPLKTLMDQGIHHPFMYFPAFFLTQSLVAQRPHPIEYAANKWKNEVWESCKALWTLWVPGQIINFALVPRYLRVPFAAGISFAWCVILSLMQGSKAAEEEAHAEAGEKATASSPLEPICWQSLLPSCRPSTALDRSSYAPGHSMMSRSDEMAAIAMLQRRQSRGLLPATHPAAALMRL